MDIQSSVGRRQGRNSQNRVHDQEVVQTLLNRIPESQGGTEGRLQERFVDGVCSDRLYQAILRFQQMHARNQADGHVDPNGTTIHLLNQFADAASQRGPTVRVLAATPVPRAQPLPQPVSNRPPISDGGTVVQGERARLMSQWESFRNQAQQSLRGNPNQAAVMAYLQRLQQAAGNAPPAVRDFVLFGNATLPDGNQNRFNARVLGIGEPIFAGSDSHTVLLLPAVEGEAGGSLVQLAPRTAFVRLHRHSARARGGSGDTTLETGNLRNHLGQLAGRH